MKKRTMAIVAAALLLCAVLSITLNALASNQGLRRASDTVTITREEYNRLQRYAKLDEIMQYIEAYYYIEPDTDAMLEMATRGLLYGLEDPYTFYYSDTEWSELWEDDEGEYAGIGIQLLGNYLDYSVTVTRVFRDTPAERAGVLKGDLLVRVADIQVDAYSMQNAVNVMRGTVDEVVEVEVVRNGENIVFKIPRAIIKVNRIEYMMLENDIGYICLYEFAGDCATAFEKALKELREDGAKALVVDLRDNGGGWVDDAVSIADLFLDKELLAYSEDRAKTREEYYTADGKDDVPLVLLVNENSASSSEILSGGLQDLKRATVVGVTTYGKGVIQYVVELTGEPTDGFQFTFAQYFTPGGAQVHKIGITPDVLAEMPEDLKTVYFKLGDMTDPQLKAAWETALSLIAE